MPFKPGDFFLSVVTFLGVLLPGAVLLFLRGSTLETVFPATGIEPRWAVFLVAAYVAGHILLAATEVLNYLALWIAAMARRLISKIKKPNPHAPRTDGDFHKALCAIRLKNADAASEIDRHMADYKLLRNLVAVFLIDLVWPLPDGSPGYGRALWDGALVALSFFGFVRMHYWARRLAFEYEDLLPQTEKVPSAAK